MNPVLLLDLVGLTARLIGEHTPRLAAFAREGAMAPMSAVLPAVTCSAQATMLTGLTPQEHGAVGNGWRDPATMETALWRQSNRLVTGEKVYETAKKQIPGFTSAKLFWWWNMGAAVDWSITPRPFYCADGLKILATYSAPTEFGNQLEGELGAFPFFGFWGPKADISSTRWISDACLRTLENERPSLTLAYLPHLDYSFQRHGPEDPRSLIALRELDGIFGELWDACQRLDIELIAVSEYGIDPVDTPVHINRALRSAGLLEVRQSPRGEELDVFASRAFALADHQLAHVYTRSSRDGEAAAEVLSQLKGVDGFWRGPERQEIGLDHPRAGDLVAISSVGAWFTYYYWLDETSRPDFATTVDIHSKPGYDPCELFVDPALGLPALRVARRLMQKKLGMRYLMDLIPTDASLVGGSHGRPPRSPEDGPVFLASRPFGKHNREPNGKMVEMTSIKDRILQLLQSECRP
ncbi:MAG TPA: alkaline phosphatase family protein [Planctomycetes bacterium]|nr:alkaline phosphatase family protein [Planctomycetota bacterium]HIL51015.1 alkaline phosphatase family protein [Planctomycetota bacterium]